MANNNTNLKNTDTTKKTAEKMLKSSLSLANPLAPKKKKTVLKVVIAIFFLFNFIIPFFKSNLISTLTLNIIPKESFGGAMGDVFATIVGLSDSTDLLDLKNAPSEDMWNRILTAEREALEESIAKYKDNPSFKSEIDSMISSMAEKTIEDAKSDLKNREGDEAELEVTIPPVATEKLIPHFAYLVQTKGSEDLVHKILNTDGISGYEEFMNFIKSNPSNQSWFNIGEFIKLEDVAEGAAKILFSNVLNINIEFEKQPSTVQGINIRGRKYRPADSLDNICFYFNLTYEVANKTSIVFFKEITDKQIKELLRLSSWREWTVGADGSTGYNGYGSTGFGDLEGRIYRAMKEEGFSDIQVAAALGNFCGESSGGDINRGVDQYNVEAANDGTIGWTQAKQNAAAVHYDMSKYASGYVTRVYGGRSPCYAGIGFAAWTNTSNIEENPLWKYISKNGEDPEEWYNNVDAQVSLFVKEVTLSEPWSNGKWNVSSHEYSLQSFRACADIDKATEIFCFGWENPNSAYAHLDKRQAAAREYLKKIESGGLDSVGYVEWAIKIAEDDTHGYSLDTTRREGSPDYDCSSLVFHALKSAGIITSQGKAFSTDNMSNVLKCAGFEELDFDPNILREGDIFWRREGGSGHTGIYIGGGKTVEAHWDYDNIPGDSSGTEINVSPLSGSYMKIYRLQN